MSEANISTTQLIYFCLDFSDDIPLLPANGKYSYDSDELNISNIHLYTGDLGDPGYASLFTGVNARTSCSTAQTPPLSRISGLFNNGKEDTNPVADAEQDEQLPVLKTLDSASIEDIWNKQPESVRGEMVSRYSHVFIRHFYYSENQKAALVVCRHYSSIN